jgi:two-component system chemotaxis sensor kinase CheA
MHSSTKPKKVSKRQNIALLGLEREPTDKELVHRLFRAVHTIKGGAMFFSLSPIIEASHVAEHHLDKVRDGSVHLSPEAIRVHFSCIDFLKGCVTSRMEPRPNASGVLLAFQTLEFPNTSPTPALPPEPAEPTLTASSPTPFPLATESAELQPVPSPSELSPEHAPRLETVKVKTQVLQQVLDQMAELSLFKAQVRSRFPDEPAILGLTSRLNALHDTILKMRMQRLDVEFSKYRRVVRDLAQTLGKKIELRLEVGEVEIDRAFVEALNEPMVHLLRNAADHGIELSQHRIDLGKPAAGTIIIRANQSGGTIDIELQDDGRGIDTDAVKQRALERGFETTENLERMTPIQLMGLIFRPGFSTASAVSTVSGRGVGLDAVKAAAERAGGKLTIDSRMGYGSLVTLTFPQSLAVSSFLKCIIGGKPFLIHRSCVEELVPVPFDLDHESVIPGREGRLMQHRDQLLPLIDLSSTLGRETESPYHLGSRILVVCKLEITTVGFLVDAVVRTEELPHKALPPLFGTNPLFSGATLTSGGVLAAILDLKSIAERAGVLPEASQARAVAKKRVLKDSTLSVQESIIIFSNHPQEFFGISSSFVSEVLKVNRDQLEARGERFYVAVKGRYYLILQIENYLQVRKKPIDQRHLVLFLLTDRFGLPIAIAGSQVFGIDTLLHNEGPEASSEYGVLEIIQHKGRLISVLDVDQICHKELPSTVKARHHDLNRLNALVVDDSSFFRSLLTRYLSEEGMHITTARDGVVALELLHAQSELPDLIISDLTMPNMGGMGLVENIRSSKRFRHIPMIAVSTITDADDIRKALAMGFDDYEVKVNRESLLEKMEQVLSRKSSDKARSKSREAS